jgi:hypothetical protein
MKECGMPVARTAPQVVPSSAPSQQKPQTSYVDDLPGAEESDSPNVVATYAVEVLNKAGRGAGISNQVRVPLAHTLPPPRDFKAEVTSQGVVLHWTAFIEPVSQTGPRYIYRVYRSTGTADHVLVGELPLSQQPEYSLTDRAFEWEKTYSYRAETVTVLEVPNRPPVQIEGDDTAEVKVFADDVFPPAAPTGLQAVFSGPAKNLFIDLIWAPVSNADLAGYNIYGHEDGTSPAKVNSELVHTPAYRDTKVESGKRYWYSVSSVDLRGNESARSEEASETVP